MSPGRALGLFLFAAVVMQAMGFVFGGLGLPGYAIAQVLGFALPSLAAARWGELVSPAHPTGWRDELGLLLPRPLAFAGAFLVGAGLWALLIGTLLRLQEALFPMPEQLVRDLQALATPEGPAWVPLACVALAPAFCEELLCRGVLQRAFTRRFGAAIGIVASAIAFALLHVSPYRLAPTFCLGLALGVVAAWSGSVAPAMLVHFLNNAAVILIGDRVDTGDPLFALAGAALVVPGFSILWRARVSPQTPSSLAM